MIIRTFFIFLIFICAGLNAQNLLNNPESIVYDHINDRYLVSNFGDGTIVQIDSNGEQSYFSTTLTRMAALHIYGDTLLVASNLEPYVGLIGFDLNTDEMVLNIPIEGSGLLNDLTSDNEGFVYITDYWDTKVYKVDISAYNYWVFAQEGLEDPNGIIFDEINNRLITTSTIGGIYPLHGVSLSDSTVSVVVDTHISSQDGIARDSNGNYYLSTWYQNACYRFDPEFSEPAELFSDGHSGPADIYCDNYNNLLCIPNFNSNSVEFIPIDLNDADDHEIIEPAILMSNHPNPFNPETVISFQLSGELALDDIAIEIYNLKGQKIRRYSIFSRQLQRTGTDQFSVTWDGTDESNNTVSSGIYYYKLSVGELVSIKKMALLK